MSTFLHDDTKVDDADKDDDRAMTIPRFFYYKFKQEGHDGPGLLT